MWLGLILTISVLGKRAACQKNHDSPPTSEPPERADGPEVSICTITCSITTPQVLVAGLCHLVDGTPSGKADLKDQDRQFRDRTRMFPEEWAKGNFSLLLTDLKDSDSLKSMNETRNTSLKLPILVLWKRAACQKNHDSPPTPEPPERADGPEYCLIQLVPPPRGPRPDRIASTIYSRVQFPNPELTTSA
ncbi:unnamed protein product [Coregonus sp. 'balchen']|nr:unnamed protein product [Coregonus sp. 'balchen']